MGERNTCFNGRELERGMEKNTTGNRKILLILINGICIRVCICMQVYEHKHLSLSRKCQHKDETGTMLSCSESQEIASSGLHRLSIKVKIICLMSLYLAAFLRNAYSLIEVIAFHILSGW
jgi:hypothetical protein